MLFYTLLLALAVVPGWAIVNPDQETANMVIYMRRPNEFGPTVWREGVQCLDTFSQLYLRTSSRYTRSYNMVLSNAANMSTPAAQIQDGFLKLINEAVSEPVVKRRLFQLRVVSDREKYVKYKLLHGELLLADFYVIVTDSLERFRNLMSNYVSHMRSWNPGATFLVLFNYAKQRHRERQVVEEIFLEMQDEYFANRVGVLFATNRTTYSFWTMDYYNSKACRTMNLRRTGECRNGLPHPDLETINKKLISQLRRVNLENCTFNMCATISAPFVESDCDNGIEMHLVDVIKNRLRFDVNQTCSNETRGVFEENGEWSGLLGRLNDRFCDFILGGYFPDNEVLENFWASDCYLSESYTWYVQLAKLRPRWMALTSIFSNETWLCFILVLLITWVFWFFIMNMLPEPSDFKDFSLAGINSVAVTLCASINERPLCNASRVFFLVLAVYGMNAVTIYTSNLISVFTNPGYQHQIDNIDEVVAAGIPFGGMEESRDWFHNDDDMWIYEQYNDSAFFEADSEGLEAVKRGERAILSSRAYILQNELSDDIFAFTKNVFSSPLQIIMKPGFPFLNEINWKIRQMRDAGLFNKIARDFYFNNTILNRIAKMRPNFQEDVVVLTTEHLEGSFAVLMVGTVCSVSCFIAELMVFWCVAPLVRKYFGRRPGEGDANKKRKRRRRGEGRKTKWAQKPKKFGIKEEEDGDTPTYDLNVMQNIRFTPVKRRIVNKEHPWT